MDTIEFRGQTIVLDPARFLTVYYTNWKGESAWRTVFLLPCPPEFNTSSFHPDRWIIRVWDIGKNAERSYDLLKCHQWSNTYAKIERKEEGSSRPTDQSGEGQVRQETGTNP